MTLSIKLNLMRLSAALCILASCIPDFVIADDSVQQVSFADVLQLAYREPDGIHQYGDHPSQYIETWYPTGASTSAGVVLVHGGCWLNAFGVDHTRALATHLSELGLTVWSLEYRRLGDSNAEWPNSLNDVVAALDYVHAVHDLPAVAVAGHSAGGHLALLAVEQSQLEPTLVIGLAAITDIERYAQASGSCQQAAAELLSLAADKRNTPLNVAPTSTLDRLLVYSGDDTIVDTAQASLGTTPTLMLEGAGHFDFIHPHTQAFRAWLAPLQATLKQDD